MTDINMALDDYVKATKPVRKPKAVKPPPRTGATAGQSGQSGQSTRGGRRSIRQRNRSGDDRDPEDTRKGRSDNGQWSHDKFEGQAKRGGDIKTSRGGQQQQQHDTRAPGVHIQMIDVHFDISDTDLHELFGNYTKSISTEFDDTDRPTGNVNLVCENMKKAKALINEYSGKSLDGHELKFRIIERQRNSSNSNGNRSGPDDNRATSRVRDFNEARGRGRGRGGRGGRTAVAVLTEKRAEIKQKREKRREPKDKRREPAKPKTQMELDAEMSKFALKNATPDSLDAQMAEFAKEREAAAAETAAPATEAAKAE